MLHLPFALLLAATAGAKPSNMALARVTLTLNALNEVLAKQQLGWNAAVNEIAMLGEEQRKTLLGALDGHRGKPPSAAALDRSQPLPASVDWRDKGGESYVTPVKNQGSCGSCWAFATAGALESYMLRTGSRDRAPDLAEQVLVSCSGAGSCKGGYIDKAASFLENSGLPPESAMPYAGENSACAVAQGGDEHAQRIGSWRHVARKVSDLKRALVQYGPLPTVMVVYEDFYYYSDGVYEHPEPFGGAVVDFFKRKGKHAILIVGYDDERQAFIVKNSWGSSWGEGGYFRVGYSQVSNDVEFGSDTLAFVAPAHGPELRASLPAGPQLAGKPLEVSGELSRRGEVSVQLDDDAPAWLADETAAGGFTYSLDAARMTEGEHRVVVRARDDAGGRGEASLALSLVAEPPPVTDESGDVEPARGPR